MEKKTYVCFRCGKQFQYDTFNNHNGLREMREVGDNRPCCNDYYDKPQPWEYRTPEQRSEDIFGF